MEALGLRRVAIVTPYKDSLTQLVAEYIENCGITVVDTRSLRVTENVAVGRLDPMNLVDIAGELDTSTADGVVLSACVQMPSLPAIPLAEQALGLPVLSAATATVYEILTALGRDPVAPDAGALLSGDRVGARVELAMSLPTTLVGSYAQPSWLIDRERLRDRFPPRVRARELWRVDPAYLEEAQDDATLLAIRDQERAGIDILTDGEMRRESYSNRFATALEGVDVDRPGTALDRSGHPNPVPRVVGTIARPEPVQVRDLEFLKANTSRRVKMTVPGPFTMSQQAQNDFYESDEELALAYAAAINEEIADLAAAGADVVQIDEPYLQARPEAARRYGVRAVNRALEGIEATTALHICFGYAAIIHERPEGYSFLSELTDCSCAPGLDRNRAVGAGPGRARHASRQDRDPGCARPER